MKSESGVKEAADEIMRMSEAEVRSMINSVTDAHKKFALHHFQNGLKVGVGLGVGIALAAYGFVTLVFGN